MTRIVKRSDGYWIVDLPMSTPDCGPYAKLHGEGEDSVQAALHGLEQFFTVELCDWYRPAKKMQVKTKRYT